MEIQNINFNYWILQSIAMGITALIIPRLRITSPFGALGTVVALAFVNSHVWDAALFFSIPDNITSHTLTLFLANGIIFWVLVKILPGIEVSGVIPALIAPVVFTVTSLFINSYCKDIDLVALGKSGVAYVQGVRDQLKAANPPHTPTPKVK